MRLPLILALIALCSPADPAPRPAPAVENPRLSVTSRCANATTQFARTGSVHRGKPARPEKLTELPPGQTYAAVYRLVDGCAIPVMYREVNSMRERGQ